MNEENNALESESLNNEESETIVNPESENSSFISSDSVDNVLSGTFSASAEGQDNISVDENEALTADDIKNAVADAIRDVNKEKEEQDQEEQDQEEQDQEEQDQEDLEQQKKNSETLESIQKQVSDISESVSSDVETSAEIEPRSAYKGFSASDDVHNYVSVPDSGSYVVSVDNSLDYSNFFIIIVLGIGVLCGLIWGKTTLWK